jgi:hypothetical protein
MFGLWLLMPEHLRLGTWDLLNTWTNRCRQQELGQELELEEEEQIKQVTGINSRLAMQLINEASLCVPGIREKRTLSQKGFELANGLPYVASDSAIHHMLSAHTISESLRLQVALGKIRLTFGHFKGELLAIDPHRVRTYSKRQMIRRKKDVDSKPCKMAQTFFCLDADTKQPICFTTGTAARNVTKATPELLKLASTILNISSSSRSSRSNRSIKKKNNKDTLVKKKVLVLADNEHYTKELMDWISTESPFDMLVPMQNKILLEKQLKNIPVRAFKTHWAGYATTVIEYNMKESSCGPYYEFIQRSGERPQDYDYNSFLCTSNRDGEEMKEMAFSFPQRWHIEEFFKNDQALGWNRFGTMNLNIQFGKMTMSLFAQAVIHMMRQRLGKPYETWDAQHLAKDFFKALEGDIRVQNDTIIVTFYNPPNAKLLKRNYENLPQQLEEEGCNPRIPWLYDYKIDFRFK